MNKPLGADELKTPGTRAIVIGAGFGGLALAIRLQSDGSVRLLGGSLYFDSTPFAGGGTAPAAIAVDTVLGRITHEGTQFLATVAAGSVAVKVREGRARLSGDRVDATVDAGEALLLAADGRVERIRPGSGPPTSRPRSTSRGARRRTCSAG